MRRRPRVPGWRRWLDARFSRESELGLRLTLAAGSFAVAIWAFGGILDAVLDDATLVHLDLVAALWIHGHVTLQGLRDFDAVTQLGTVGVGVTVATMSLWLWRRREWLLLSGWFGANLGGWMVAWALKAGVHRARPRYAAQFLHRASYSFPSGHTMGAMICYPAAAMVLVRVLGVRGWQRRALYATATVVVLVVGVSRVYLGVHYPSDVAGGIAAGAAWLAACWLLLSTLRHRGRAAERRGAVTASMRDSPGRGSPAAARR